MFDRVLNSSLHIATFAPAALAKKHVPRSHLVVILKLNKKAAGNLSFSELHFNTFFKFCIRSTIAVDCIFKKISASRGIIHLVFTQNFSYISYPLIRTQNGKTHSNNFSAIYRRIV